MSDVEDEPAAYQSSEDEWEDDEPLDKRRAASRRTSQRLSKKPRISLDVSDAADSESDDEYEEKPKPKKGRNGVNKKRKIEKPQTSPKAKTASPKVKKEGQDKDASTKKILPRIVFSGDYATGSFVIKKADAQDEEPCIWRIDGKALLQKYEPFTDEEKVKHKNTSIYTGWSALDKDQYAPVTVDVYEQSHLKTIVGLHWEKIKEISVDSE